MQCQSDKWSTWLLIRQCSVELSPALIKDLIPQDQTLRNLITCTKPKTIRLSYLLPNIKDSLIQPLSTSSLLWQYSSSSNYFLYKWGQLWSMAPSWENSTKELTKFYNWLPNMLGFAFFWRGDVGPRRSNLIGENDGLKQKKLTKVVEQISRLMLKLVDYTSN